MLKLNNQRYALIGFGVGCLLTSCSVSMPKVDLVAYNLSLGAGSSVTLKAENPNGISVTSTSIVLDLVYLQKAVGRLQNDSSIRFPAKKSIEFPLKATLNTSAILQSAPNALMLTLQGKKLPVQIQGSVQVKIMGLFRKSIPIDTTLMVDPKEFIGR